MKILYFKRNSITHEATDLFSKEKFDAFYSDLEGKETELKTCLSVLKMGDTLYIERVSHLAKTEIAAANVLKQIAKLGANVWINRSQRLIVGKDSPFLSVTNEMIQAVKKFKTAFQKLRINKGVEKARAEGRRNSRPRLPLPENFSELARQWIAKKITLTQGAAACNMTVTRFRNRCREFKRKAGNEISA